jgi:DNA transposition AAA+ family ATPase
MVMSLGVVFAVMAGGALVALIGHLRFLSTLKRHEPDLWRSYRRLAFTLEPSYWQHPKLVAAVYSRISDPLVRAARRTDLLCKYIFGITSLLAALMFCAVHIIPALLAP